MSGATMDRSTARRVALAALLVLLAFGCKRKGDDAGDDPPPGFPFGPRAEKRPAPAPEVLFVPGGPLSTDPPAVRRYDAEGLPLGNDLDAVLTRLNHRAARGNFHLYQLETANLRPLNSPDQKRRAEVFRTLQTHAGTPAAQPSISSIPFVAWQQMMDWASVEQVPELCQMLRAEAVEARQQSLFAKLAQFKDPRCAGHVAPFLAQPRWRGDAEHLLRSLGANGERVALPYLASTYDKDTRTAAMQVVADTGAAEGAKVIEALTRDPDLWVRGQAKSALVRVARRHPVEVDLLAALAVLKAAIAGADPGLIQECADQIDTTHRPDHPKRAEIFKGFVECSKVPDPKGYARRPVLLGALKWATPADVAGVCELLAVPAGESLVFQKLKEYRDPRTAPLMASYLNDALKKDDAAGVLRAIGAPAEAAVVPYTYPKYGNGAEVPFATRLAAIEVLGDVGTANSVQLLRALANELNTRDAATKALGKVLNRAR